MAPILLIKRSNQIEASDEKNTSEKHYRDLVYVTDLLLLSPKRIGNLFFCHQSYSISCFLIPRDSFPPSTHFDGRCEEDAAAEADENGGQPLDHLLVAHGDAVEEDESDGGEDSDDVDDPGDDATPPRKRQTGFATSGSRMPDASIERIMEKTRRVESETA